MIDYRIYLVTDDPSRYAGNWIDNIVAAVEGGVTCVQYRDTENTRDIQYGRILALRDALAKYKTPIIVNNDAELAAAVHADGIHVGQHDMPVGEVRKIVGSNCEIGLSITAKGQAENGADCLGIGPVFDARKTKADASDAVGVDGLRELLAEHTLPSVAIGGITLDNAAAVLSTGITGLAIVSAFSKSDNPYKTARNFSLLFDNRRESYTSVT